MSLTKIFPFFNKLFKLLTLYIKKKHRVQFTVMSRVTKSYTRLCPQIFI